MRFLGIDFGWRSQPSGLCCLHWRENKLHLKDLRRLDAVDGILAWVDTQTELDAPALIAVDAPTLIPNETGMRLPDRLTHRHFGKYHAGCYPANLSRPFADRTVALGLSLEARGFAHAPTIAPQTLGRFQIEVFPHPAIVNLFGLDRILKYKKGRLIDRAAELLKLRSLILELAQFEPSLQITSIDLPEIPRTGAALKDLEDRLDSLICAYVAAHWWYWGSDRNLVLGNATEGYIVVPLVSDRPT